MVHNFQYYSRSIACGSQRVLREFFRCRANNDLFELRSRQKNRRDLAQHARARLFERNAARQRDLERSDRDKTQTLEFQSSVTRQCTREHGTILPFYRHFLLAAAKPRKWQTFRAGNARLKRRYTRIPG